MEDNKETIIKDITEAAEGRHNRTYVYRRPEV